MSQKEAADEYPMMEAPNDGRIGFELDVLPRPRSRRAQMNTSMTSSAGVPELLEDTKNPVQHKAEPGFSMHGIFLFASDRFVFPDTPDAPEENPPSQSCDPSE